ncbi:MAG: hypothetical protein SFV22_03810 [Saprospiraceae bacterium]|nr:hypothetical protein [Saprospiraceae bacterium]
MKKLINRRDFRFTPQSELASLTENILQRIKEKPELAFLSEKGEALEAVLEQYIHALAAARNRGILEVAVKNEMRTALIKALEQVADTIEKDPLANETLALSAGFKTRKTSLTVHEPPIPKVLNLTPTGNRGELKVALQTWQGIRPRGFMHACEYSTDQGQTWRNGKYKPSQRFVLSGLPPYSVLLVRFRTIAPNGDTSDWSETMTAVVS